MSTTKTRRFSPGEFLRTESAGGVALLAAAAVALIAANSPLSAAYTGLRELHVGPHALHLDLSVGDWVRDGMLAVFFYVAGLELKRELLVGRLADRRTALMPVLAAAGGMVVPAVLTLALSLGAPTASQAWAIPVATDIAFALGVLALTGGGMPAAARVFLLSLAVVDDLGAILLIAAVFTKSLNLVALLAAVALLGAFAWAQHERITTPWLHVPLAVATWAAVHSSGVHATVAGVALGLLTRVRRDPGEQAALGERLEHRLQPWSAGLVVPLFALFAAGVPVNAEALGELAHDRVALAVLAGLALGKFLGIFGTSYLAERLRIASRPHDVGWGDLAVLAVLGGIGFTVSLLMTDLSLTGPGAERAKAAVLLASALTSVVAALVLVVRRRVTARHRRAEVTRG